MHNRLRRPLTWVWVVAFALALLLGFVIGGNPVVARDVPLSDRQIVPTTLTPDIGITSDSSSPSTNPSDPASDTTQAGG